jgi:hypothetical protein
MVRRRREKAEKQAQHVGAAFVGMQSDHRSRRKVPSGEGQGVQAMEKGESPVLGQASGVYREKPVSVMLRRHFVSAGFTRSQRELPVRLQLFPTLAQI